MTTWKPWTLEEIADWERQCLAGTLFTDAPAKSEYVAKPRLGLVIDGVEHGTVRAYVDGCTCKPCVTKATPYLAQLGLDR
jgi:hypothetical protein